MLKTPLNFIIVKSRHVRLYSAKNLPGGAILAIPDKSDLLRRNTAVSFDVAKTGSPPLVVLLGWLGCKRRYLDKFVELYASHGIPTVSYISSPRCLTQPELAAEKSRDLLTSLSASDLPSDLRGNAAVSPSTFASSSPLDKIFVHTFSGNGQAFYGVMLQQIEKDTSGKFASITPLIRGSLVDSGPPIPSLSMITRGFVSVVQPNLKPIPVPRHPPSDGVHCCYCHKVISPDAPAAAACSGVAPTALSPADVSCDRAMHCALKDPAELASGKTSIRFVLPNGKAKDMTPKEYHTFLHDLYFHSTSQVYEYHPILKFLVETFVSKPMIKAKSVERFNRVKSTFAQILAGVPELYLYGNGDTLVPPSEIRDFIRFAQSHKKPGVQCEEAFFMDSPHVGHYRKYPTEYAQIALDFIARRC